MPKGVYDRKIVPLRDRFMASVRPDEASGCWEWVANRHNGYGQIRVNGKTCRAHRVSYELSHGPIGEGMHVLHRCDNPGCVNPDHLFLGTQAENAADMVSKGRQSSGAEHGTAVGRRAQRGSRHHGAKLCEADVIAIRSAEGVTQRELALRYGISRERVSEIRSGKGWSHLRDERKDERC